MFLPLLISQPYIQKELLQHHIIEIKKKSMDKLFSL